MKRRMWFTALMLAAFVSASCKPKASGSSKPVVELALQKAGGQEQVLMEAEKLFTQFGHASLKGFDNSELTNSPALTRLASSLSGEVLGIWPPGADEISVPAHVRIRFGTHSDYQFLMILKEALLFQRISDSFASLTIFISGGNRKRKRHESVRLLTLALQFF